MRLHAETLRGSGELRSSRWTHLLDIAEYPLIIPTFPQEQPPEKTHFNDLLYRSGNVHILVKLPWRMPKMAAKEDVCS